eukprot:7242506-Ditylum_brightwellii.AAC.1
MITANKGFHGIEDLEIESNHVSEHTEIIRESYTKSFDHVYSFQIKERLAGVNLSPALEGSNLDIENRDNVQSTIYISATPLAIEQVRHSLRLLEPMAQG